MNFFESMMLIGIVAQLVIVNIQLAEILKELRK